MKKGHTIQKLSSNRVLHLIILHFKSDNYLIIKRSNVIRIGAGRIITGLVKKGGEMKIRKRKRKEGRRWRKEGEEKK